MSTHTRDDRDDDRALGMDRPIARRDFLEGVARPVGAALLGGGASGLARAAGDDPAPPPADRPLGGPSVVVGGQPIAASAWLHARRDGAPRPELPAWQEGDETADLVVVGAGISGLAAAWWWRRERPHDRVLLLDALPMPGGHAQRNEFTASNGRRLIGYGGSEALDSPSLWSPAAHALVDAVGIPLASFKDWYDSDFDKRHGLDKRASWYAPELWGGRGGLVIRDAKEPAADWLARTPLSPAAQADFARLLAGPPDPWPELSRSQKRTRLAGMTYDRFLVDVLKMHPDVARAHRDGTRGYFGAGTDATSALDASTLSLPGFQSMSLGDEPDRLMSPSGRHLKASQDEYIYHFPDGNAGLVRAMLRSLIPDALPGTGMESLVLATRDDARLDVPGSPVRLRTSSPVVDVRHAGGDPAHARAVDVAYAGAGGTLRTVRAGHVVLACFHRVIPFLCTELSAPQVAALNDQCKVPLIYGTVMLRNWRPFAKAGISRFGLPGSTLWEEVKLDMPVSVGRYRFPDSPDEPVLLHLPATVLDGPAGSPAREQCAAGRRRLYAMSFEDVERDLRRTLNGALGPFGFDAARDVEAITLNRWAHGYAYEYMRPWDPFWPDGPLPVEAARRGWGRIAIANADAGAYAYAHSAIDQATRAVAELLPHARLPAWWKVPGPSPAKLKIA